MKLIKNIESIVNASPPGDKIATFHQQILLYAKELSSTGFKAKGFFDIATTLDKPAYHTEYNKMMALAPKIIMRDCNLCEKMIELSHDTWDRIKFIRGNATSLKVHEPTITQNLLFELAKFSKDCAFKQVEAFEAVKEKVNGNDIEFFIQQPNGKYIFLPIQAKILYPSNTYEQIPYKNQNKDLIRYAKRTNGYPLYLLYNYTPNNQSLNDYGCSIVDAYYVALKHHTKSPTFDDFHISSTPSSHPIASTWQSLICQSVSTVDNSYTNKKIKKIYSDDAYFLTQDDIIEEGQWEKIDLDKIATDVEVDKVGVVESSGQEFATEIINEESEVSQVGFAPKYKIVISNEEFDMEDMNE